MPRKGRKTVDLKNGLVNRYQTIYDNNIDIINRHGITSFSGFITIILESLYEEGHLPPWIRELLVT